jgi:NAD(P)-dependent dehydrogenase (short-subunit alcohol dehydrogenase family)
MDGFQGKTALVTGGAGGIGSMVCEALLESGCRVVLHDLPASGGAAKARSLCQKFGDGQAIFAPGERRHVHGLARDVAVIASVSRSNPGRRVRYVPWIASSQ